ncbi:TFIIB-type zinc finger domain-containing protein [Candidatus Enterococcus clewellii]|uniref:Uncharacterized protein n=1 Tax=Candidatus Enterococcus clewellii TaxID=1834193 RepID=A0A242K6S8_9ENTE|nr:TFIIB-type zinc finger domain-containing protein [Enterococcus sp. 9E7_DIV0242]OTP16022.1 hypothetical protein A5888_002236 [Enterococcus sp. 9E7_DIV0242]
MKKIYCEACGSVELVKDASVYTCPYCHTVYENGSSVIEEKVKTTAKPTISPKRPSRQSTIPPRPKDRSPRRTPKTTIQLVWIFFLSFFVMGSIGVFFDSLKNGDFLKAIEYLSIFVVCSNALYTAFTSKKIFITKKIAGGWAFLLLVVFWAMIQGIFGVQV